MADTKVSALTALAAEPADTDEFYINDGGVSKRIAWSTIKAVFALAAQGSLADTALQPADVGSAAAADATDFATAAQGATAETAVQPGDDAADLGSGAATDGYVLTADGIGGAAWEAAGGGSGDFLADGTVDMTGQFKTDVGTFATDVADGASSVGFLFNTTNAFSTSGAKIASFKNNSTEKAYIDKDGGFYSQNESGTGFYMKRGGFDVAFRLNANTTCWHSSHTVGWASSGNAAGTNDTGLKRSAAGVVQVTDGSTGTGQLIFIVPTSDPGISGALWNNAGTLSISA